MLASANRFLRSTFALWLFAGLLVASVAGFVLADRVEAGQGLLRVLDGDPRSGPNDVVFKRIYTDANDFAPNQPSSTVFRGYLWAPRGGTYGFTLVSEGAAELRVDGAAVVEAAPAGTPRAASGDVALGAGVVPIEIVYRYEPATRGLLDVRWQPPGARLARRVPTWALFPAEPDASALAAAARLRAAWLAVRVALAVAFGGLALTAAAQVRARGTDWRVLALLALFAVALAVRVVFIMHRAANDPAFYTLVPGTDMRTFEGQSRDLMRDVWPGDRGYYHQPGLPYFLYAAHLVVGPGMLDVRLVIAVLNALGVLLLVDTGRILLADERAGWLGAALAAVYPGFIFWGATLLGAPVTVFLVMCLLWLLARQMRHASWVGAVALGVVFAGLLALRPNMAAIMPLAAGSILLSAPAAVTKRLALGVVMVVVAVLLFLPIPLHNFGVGADYISTPIGMQAFYQGNNRDSLGFYTNEQAWQEARLLGEDYRGAFIRDVTDEPGRWAELLLRKTGMFWSGQEIATNLSYTANGTDVSWLLRLLRPLNLTVVALLGLTGTVLAVRDGRRGAWLLIGFGLLMMGSIVAFTPDSRIRLPSFPALMPLAGYALAATYDALRGRERARLLAIAGVGVGVGVLLVLLNTAVNTLPRPRLLAERRLPEDVTRLDLNYGDRVRLVGYRVKRGEDGVSPEAPLLVTVYWQRLAPMDEDYSVFLHLIGRDGERYGQKDTPIGLISFQHYPTSRWRDDRIFQEEYLIVADRLAPHLLAADLWVGVYDPDTLDRLPLADGSGDAFRLATVRLEPGDSDPPPAAEREVSASFGGWADLTGYDLTRSGDTLEITLHWAVTGRPPQDYLTFIHLIGDGVQPAAQADGYQFGGQFPTGLWRPGDVLLDRYELALPPDLPAGEYAIYVGLYDLAVGRVPAADASGAPLPDSSLRLVTLQLP